jgi:hypothetical protein
LLAKARSTSGTRSSLVENALRKRRSCVESGSDLPSETFEVGTVEVSNFAGIGASGRWYVGASEQADRLMTTGSRTPNTSVPLRRKKLV